MLQDLLHLQLCMGKHNSTLAHFQTVNSASNKTVALPYLTVLFFFFFFFLFLTATPSSLQCAVVFLIAILS